MKLALPVLAAALMCGCTSAPLRTPDIPVGYLDSSGRVDALAGGVRRVPVTTAAGTFHVFVRRFGNHPRIKVLVLHGGPGMTHEYLEAMDTFMPAAGVEYYGRSGSTPRTSSSTGTRGVACSRSSTRCSTRSTSAA
jgi:proline iminopeptidase